MALNETDKNKIIAFVGTFDENGVATNSTDELRAGIAALASNYDRYTAKKFVEMFSQIKKTKVTLTGIATPFILTADGVESLFTLLENSTALSVENKQVVVEGSTKVIGSASDSATVILGGDFLGKPEKLIVDGEEVDTRSPQLYKIAGEDIVVNDITIKESAIVDLAATGNLVINNVTVDNSDGSLAQGTTRTNSVLKVTNEQCDSIVLKEMKMKATDTINGKNLYNGVEFWAGNNCKSILIEKCAFLGSYTHNAINIYSCANNATITVKDCYFDNFNKDGNILRLSNTNGATNVQILFDNCVFDHWDGDSLAEGETNAYAGFCLCQDYTSGTIADEAANKLFGPSKIKITLKNCCGPTSAYGNTRVIPAPASAADVCATGLKDQLCYVYGNKTGVFPYSADVYPEIIVIPGEANLPEGVMPVSSGD